MSENESQVIDSNAKKPHSSAWQTIGIIIVALAFIILIATYSLGYFQLTKTNEMFAKQLNSIQSTADDQQKQISKIESDLENVQSNLQKTSDLAQSHEKVMGDLQGGNLSKWYISEAEYLINLANEQVQFTHQYSSALELLQRADKVLENISDPNLLGIRKAIAVNIAQLQAINVADVTSIYTRLSAVDQQIDSLPLQNTLLKPNDTTPAASSTANKSWWEKGMDNTWQGLQKIVVVRKNMTDKMPFMLPDQKAYLLQNLHERVQVAMWAALNRNATVYQSALSELRNWISRYFDTQNQQTQALLNTLNDLQKMVLDLPTLNFGDTIKLFHNAANGANVTTNTQAAPTSPATSVQ